MHRFINSARLVMAWPFAMAGIVFLMIAYMISGKEFTDRSELYNRE